jgi:hypothetical protein
MEALVLNMLLDGDDDRLTVLRAQVPEVVVTKREFTGVGFFTTLAVADGAPRFAYPRMVISDVHADITGLEHGGGFVLFVKDGAISTLEGYTFAEPWPDNATILKAHYWHPPTPGVATVVDSSERDVERALRRYPR